MAAICSGVVLASVASDGAPPPGTSVTGPHGGGVLSAPHVINIYWDWNWDADHPQMTKAEIDAATRTLLAAPSYLTRLSQYGVGQGKLLGSFTPADLFDQHHPLCGSTRAANTVSSFDILAFVECEDLMMATHGIDITDPNLLLALYLPASANIVDPGGMRTCTSYSDYHFFGSGPVSTFAYTVVPAACSGGTLGGIIANSMHELIEAATDPVILTGFYDAAVAPPSNASIPWPSGWSRPSWVPSSISFPNVVSILQHGEVADLCEPGTAVVSGLTASQYWSQSDRACWPIPPPPPTPTCPAGAAWNGVACACTILGQSLGSNGCACPAGEQSNGNACVCTIQGETPGPSGCSCPVGQQVSGGRCVDICPGNSVWSNGTCGCGGASGATYVANVGCSCPMGEEFTAGVGCRCPSGQVFNGCASHCEPVVPCPVGQLWNCTARKCQPPLPPPRP